MVAERICRIPVSDLNTIRLSIKGIATELPLDIKKINTFFEQQQRFGLTSQGLHEIVVGLADDLLKVQKAASGDLAIELVITDPDGKTA